MFNKLFARPLKLNVAGQEIAFNTLAEFEFFDGELPAYVDIELAVMEPATLTKFRGRDDRTAALDFLSRQIGRTHVFRQRGAIRPATAQLRSLTFN